jgi:hypothetical protein
MGPIPTEFGALTGLASLELGMVLYFTTARFVDF